MSAKSASLERRSFLGVVTVLLVLSLVAAFVLFYFLDSYAQIQNKGISLGGAAAGFVVIFLLLRDTYFRVTSAERKFAQLSAEEKIQKLQDQMDGIITSKLDNFVVPEGYKREVSREFQFGFCYPENWEFSRFPEETRYGLARDLKSARNFNVIVSDIKDARDNLKRIYESSLAQVLALMPNAALVFKEDYPFMGLAGMKYRVDWITNAGERLALYQFLVADRNRKNLYIISFTTTQKDFASSKLMFDTIASTFRI